MTCQNTTVQITPTEEVCFYNFTQYELCLDSVLALCEININLTEVLNYIPEFKICSETTFVDNETSNSTQNATTNGTSSYASTTQNPLTTDPVGDAFLNNCDNVTNGNMTVNSTCSSNLTTENTPTPCIPPELFCYHFAQDFCGANVSLRLCPIDIDDLQWAMLNETGVHMRTFDSRNVTSNVTADMKRMEVLDRGDDVMCACQPFPPPVEIGKIIMIMINYHINFNKHPGCLDKSLGEHLLVSIFVVVINPRFQPF